MIQTSKKVLIVPEAVKMTQNICADLFKIFRLVFFATFSLVFHEGGEMKHSHDVFSFHENTSEAGTCAYELEGRIYYCATETSNSCKEKSEYEKLPTT